MGGIKVDVGKREEVKAWENGEKGDRRGWLHVSRLPVSILV